MSIFHIYCECGAIGDTAFNICRAHIGMSASGYKSTIVHTSPIFFINNKPNPIPIKKEVLQIWDHCNFVDKVEIDIDLLDQKSIYFSEKYQAKIAQPMISREYNNILNWIDLKKHLPTFPKYEKIAVFQPISLKYKPTDHLDDYIPIWNRCLKTLLKNNYQIVMVGGEDDEIEKTFDKKILGDIHNKIGEWSLLQSLSFLLHQADVVISCDSWAAIWGIAARKRTFVSWGYRMEQNIDFWATEFIGNRDCYTFGWSSQKDYCDAFLANSISEHEKKITDEY